MIKLATLIKALFSKYLDSLNIDIVKTKKASDIYFSTGDELENIRAVENAVISSEEDEQRQLIFLKIAEKHSEGTFYNLINVLELTGSGQIIEYRGRFDAILDIDVNRPEIIADSLRAAKAAGVSDKIYLNDNIFKLDQENLDIAKLGGKL